MPGGPEAKHSKNFTYLKGLYERAHHNRSEKALERADTELEMLSDSLPEHERRALVEISVDVAGRIGVKRHVFKLGKFGDVGTDQENR